mgnify:CR=1 FL=1
MIITYQGQNYDIINWNDFRDKLLSAIGFELAIAIRQEIDRQGLVATAQFRQGVHTEIQNGELLITNVQPYAVFVEYGSIGTEKGVTDPYGEGSRGARERKAPPIGELKDWAKRRGIENVWALAKHIQRYGTPAFAPYRRVMYNENKMGQIITKAVGSATK